MFLVYKQNNLLYNNQIFLQTFIINNRPYKIIQFFVQFRRNKSHYLILPHTSFQVQFPFSFQFFEFLNILVYHLFQIILIPFISILLFKFLLFKVPKIIQFIKNFNQFLQKHKLLLKHRHSFIQLPIPFQSFSILYIIMRRILKRILL